MHGSYDSFYFPKSWNFVGGHEVCCMSPLNITKTCGANQQTKPLIVFKTLQQTLGQLSLGNSSKRESKHAGFATIWKYNTKTLIIIVGGGGFVVVVVVVVPMQTQKWHWVQVGWTHADIGHMATPQLKSECLNIHGLIFWPKYNVSPT